MLRQLGQIRHALPTDTFKTMVASLVPTCLDYSSNVQAGLPVYLAVVAERGYATDVPSPSIEPHHRRTFLPPLAGASPVQDLRSGLQSLAWTRAGIPWSTELCSLRISRTKSTQFELSLRQRHCMMFHSRSRQHFPSGLS